MFQEIKYRLFEIFLTQKKKLALFSCLIFVGLFAVSQTTHAFALDLANVQLDALDFVDKIINYLVSLALLTIESATLLIISANLLDWSSSLPVGLDNGIVNAGWHFTSGLANLSFILIFIVIALSYVLGLTSLAMKKALPRLIIVALLINFSLLFVKMLSDIGWIAQGSFRSVFFDGGGFATAAIEPLKASAFSLIRIIIGIPAAYMFIALVPYANVAALITIGGLVLTGNGGVITGTISQSILIIVFNFIMSFIFLIFTALFLIRIAIIWILAIFAPLALMAFVLPQTKKQFEQWMKTLLQWVFLGIVVFFLAGLGIKLFHLIIIDAGQGISFKEGEVLGKWEFFDTFYKYIFLMIYLLVVLGACKKLVPTGVQMIWGLGEKALMGGEQRIAGFTRRKGIVGMAKWERGKKETAERVETNMKGGRMPTFGEKLRLGAWIKRPEQAEKIKYMAEAKEKSLMEKILTEEKAKVLKAAPKEAEDRRNYLRAELLKEETKGITRSLDKIAAIMDIMTKEGKIGKVEQRFITDAVKRGVDPDKILERRPDLAPTLGKTIADIIDKMAPEDAQKKIQRESYQNGEVVFHVLKDQTKLDNITRNGKMDIKKEILNTLNTSDYQVRDPRDAKILYDRLNTISGNPRWPKV